MIMNITQRLYRITLASALLLGIAGCATTPSPSRPDQHAEQPTARSEDSSSRNRMARSFDEAVRRGDDAWSSGNTDAALYLYVQALSFQPRDINTLGKIGLIHQGRGNLDLARKAFELAATTAPNDTRVSSHLGFVLLAQDDIDGADTWLRKSVAQDANDWRVYDALGMIAQRRGHYEDALTYLQRASTLAPSAPGPLLHRGAVELASQDYAKAEDTLQQALQTTRTSEAWRMLGEAQAHRGEYAKALASLTQAVDVPAAYNLIGQVAMTNGDDRVALDYFQKAAESSPVYFPEAQQNVALARERLEAGHRPGP
jgi:Flp pilus assembly protein TadD